jgi:hypothetical protein
MKYEKTIIKMIEKKLANFEMPLILPLFLPECLLSEC